MTKSEILSKIQDVYNKLDEIDSDLGSLQKDVRKAMGMLEDIPEDASEIKDDKDENPDED